MTTTDNNILLYNKIKCFDNNYLEGRHKEKTSESNAILEIDLASTWSSEQIDTDDMILSCCDSICIECGNDHSFRPNFEGVVTSIDAIPKILPELFCKAGEVN
jgi:hypothetical protein